jgi:cellulose synthase/poly-beta-1,6-N-acetylglucosamine synthase-like glycosyltransferase
MFVVALSPMPELERPRWSSFEHAARDDVLCRDGRFDPSGAPSRGVRPWWLPLLGVVAALAVGVTVSALVGRRGPIATVGSPSWWALTAVAHLPFMLIVVFLVGGMVERIGYFARGRAAEHAGRVPGIRPTVCVQLPMFNEHAVAVRTIEAACRLRWPDGRLTIQVLDDSTDPETRELVAATCARMRDHGVDCRLLHRGDRSGYKAGALEAGRTATNAEFVAIFDADFVPRPDFLERAMAYFYDSDGRPLDDVALVQAQWGHLNADQSRLTRAQSLWVDDHHTVQMSWRSAQWRFVNFTGTAGIWRARAIAHVGGWRGASLVEDCELSFRHLFAGYRTRFVKELVAPAELPATYTAYKAQQKRWTQGWVQLQRLHLTTLLRTRGWTRPRKAHLAYHMCVAWQWPLWALWITLLPIAMSAGLWLGALGPVVGIAAYLAPTVVWLAVSATIATAETRHTYAGGRPGWRWGLGRVLPYVVVNTGMLPHQLCAFAEGLFGQLHSEFERTPKAGSEAGATAAPLRASRVRIHRPYVVAEAGFVTLQGTWALLFASRGLWWCAAGAAWMAGCVAYVAWFYGDHAGRRLGCVKWPPGHDRGANPRSTS